MQVLRGFDKIMRITNRFWVIKLSCIFIFFVIHLTSCSTPPKPTNVDNICAIFSQYPDWYWAALKSERRWGVPIAVQMSIMRQESSFNGKAKPSRTKLFGVVPWFRKSDAYGYAQVKDATWAEYKESAGGIFSSRSTFKDAIDFIGWYANNANRRAGISKSDAYRLYLAYHEGIGGYQRGTYRGKQWLIRVSKHVAVRAAIWRRQLQGCQNNIHKSWYDFF